MGFWVVSTYTDVAEVLGDPQTFSSEEVVGPDRAKTFAALLEEHADDPRIETVKHYYRLPPITSDGAMHRREHDFVAKAFTPKRVAGLEPTMRALCEELADNVIGRPGVSFVTEFAVPLPVKTTAAALGLPPEDYIDFKRWSDGFHHIIGALHPTPEVVEEFLDGCAGFTAYMLPLIEERRRDPAGDVISALTGQNEAGHQMSNDEMLPLVAALLLAGHETTTSALAGAMLYLCRLPELQEQLRNDPSQIPVFAEEALRLTTPAQALFRRATAAATIGGAEIAEGDYVLLRFAAANRDPSRFESPLEPRLDRDVKRHLTFGRGIHTCIGAPLARTEIRVAFETLLARTSLLTLADRSDAVFPGGNQVTAKVDDIYIDAIA
jgi:cytochrome P450